VAPGTEARADSDDIRRYDGWYGGGLVGGAIAPSFPGVAGVGGATAFLGTRSGVFDLRLSLGGFGAAFDAGTLGFVAFRAETLFWVADAYGLGVGAGPCVGYYEDDFVGGGVLGGALVSATPVAVRFEAGSALLELSLAGGAIVGSVGPVDGVFARPYLLIGFAAYSQ
jgi:hypothetical protein